MIENFFTSVIEHHTQELYGSYQHIGGGCINNAARIQTTNRAYFLKWNNANEQKLFAKEAMGLEILRLKSHAKIPKVLGKGVQQGYAYLLLEWVEKGHANASFWEDFGYKLAKMHQNTSEAFGLEHANFIGRLPQSNKWHKEWVDFFVEERLSPQIKMAFENHLIDKSILEKFEVLFNKFSDLIPNEKSSLLHGDLWSGNFIVDESANPVLIDPAVYYGHRETELAFTTLFGGFDTTFYEAYKHEYPLAHGFEDRIDIHNLYPLLVHVNLFGTSYLSGIQQTLKRHT